MPEKRMQIIHVLIVFFFAVAVYGNAVLNGFVYDDWAQVVENPWIRDWSHIGEIFSTGVWGFQAVATNYYRPLMHVTYMFVYHLFGLSPWGFHLVNVLLHAGNSVLVFFLASRLFGGSSSNPLSPAYESASPSVRGRAGEVLSPPFIAAVLFAVHPIHTEAVAWVAGLPELSFALFFLLSFYLYMRWREGDGKGMPVLSLLFFSLAALYKETALTLPLLLPAYDLSFRRGPSGAHVSGRLRSYLPYLAVAGVYLALRVHFLGSLVPVRESYQSATGPGGELNTYQYFINFFALFAQYLEKLILPVNLNAWHVFRPVTSLLTPRGLISLLVTAAFLSILILAAKRSKTAFLSLLLIVVPLMPAFYIPGLGTNFFAERYLYLPSLGFVMLIAMALTWVRVHVPRSEKTLSVVLIVAVGLYSAMTISRNSVWKDDFSLWSDSVRKSPDGYMPHNNLGMAYGNMGYHDLALEHFEKAVQLAPDYAIARYNLGVAYANKVWLDRAIGQLEIAVKLAPDFKSLRELGFVYMGKGEINKGIEHLERALMMNPSDGDTQYKLGIAYAKTGQFDKAIERLEAAVRLNPDNPFFRGDLNMAYEMRGAAVRNLRDAAEDHR